MLLEDLAKGRVGLDHKVRAATVNPVPMSGLGTAGWRGEKCTRAVLDFLQSGGRHVAEGSIVEANSKRQAVRLAASCKHLLTATATYSKK